MLDSREAVAALAAHSGQNMIRVLRQIVIRVVPVGVRPFKQMLVNVVAFAYQQGVRKRVASHLRDVARDVSNFVETQSLFLSDLVVLAVEQRFDDIDEPNHELATDHANDDNGRPPEYRRYLPFLWSLDIHSPPSRPSLYMNGKSNPSGRSM